MGFWDWFWFRDRLRLRCWHGLGCRFWLRCLFFQMFQQSVLQGGVDGLLQRLIVCPGDFQNGRRQMTFLGGGLRCCWCCWGRSRGSWCSWCRRLWWSGGSYWRCLCRRRRDRSSGRGLCGGRLWCGRGGVCQQIEDVIGFAAACVLFSCHGYRASSCPVGWSGPPVISWHRAIKSRAGLERGAYSTTLIPWAGASATETLLRILASNTLVSS